MKPCTKCHAVLPLIAFSIDRVKKDGRASYCKPCKRVMMRDYKIANHAAVQTRQRLWETANRDLVRRSTLKQKYGLTETGFAALMGTQHGVCAICAQPERRRKRQVLSVDHCHVSGRVRGLLCDACNTGLGRFQDDIGRLQQAIEYLRRATHGAQSEQGEKR